MDLQVHPYCCKSQNFILFYGWIVFRFVYKPHLLYPLICWWTLGLHLYLNMQLWILGCLYIFKLNVFSCFCFLFFVFLVYKPRSRIIELYGSSMLFFWGISIMLSIVAAPIYIPTNSVQRFLFLHILSNICYL